MGLFGRSEEEKEMRAQEKAQEKERRAREKAQEKALERERKALQKKIDKLMRAYDKGKIDSATYAEKMMELNSEYR